MKHAINGSGGTGILVPIPSGSLISNVHVHNGTLKGFAIGIDLSTVASEINDMTISGNQATPGYYSIRIANGQQNILMNNVIHDSNVYVTSGGNMLTNNTLQNSSILIALGGNNLVIGNTLNGGRIELDGSGSNIIQDCVVSKGGGIFANGPGASGNLIRTNTVNNNIGDGIAMGEHATENTITENTILRNGQYDLFIDETLTGGAFWHACLETSFGNTFNSIGVFPPTDPGGCIGKLQ